MFFKKMSKKSLTRTAQDLRTEAAHLRPVQNPSFPRSAAALRAHQPNRALARSRPSAQHCAHAWRTTSAHAPEHQVSTALPAARQNEFVDHNALVCCIDAQACLLARNRSAPRASLPEEKQHAPKPSVQQRAACLTTCCDDMPAFAVLVAAA